MIKTWLMTLALIGTDSAVKGLLDTFEAKDSIFKDKDQKALYKEQKRLFEAPFMQLHNLVSAPQVVVVEGISNRVARQALQAPWTVPFHRTQCCWRAKAKR